MGGGAGGRSSVDSGKWKITEGGGADPRESQMCFMPVSKPMAKDTETLCLQSVGSQRDTTE